MDCPTCRAPTSDMQSFCARCGTSLHTADPAGDVSTRMAPYSPDALETGTTFAGRYQIIEELGRGGMGRVYKVIDQEVHAKVALKLIRPEIAFDQTTIDRFRQELTTAREISHKNICRMYDLGRHGTTYFLTMEYVAGEDLKSMIAMSGQLGVGTAISIAKQVCDGLAEAHRLGVVHRDLKPQNIQIDKGGHAKIMDFGIARSVVAKGVTDGGMAIGTPQYMSPEQAEARGVDARSDLYALGVILYEMLTGHVPFDADTPLAVAMKHKLESPRDPLELNASIPADLGRLILKCLEKDKERRYQSAGEVHADLVRIEQGLPTTAKVVPQQRPTTSKQITLPFTTRQLLAPALVVVALVAVIVGAWRLWPRQAANVASPTGKPTIAVLYFENNTGTPQLDWLRTGLTDMLVTDLSQSPDLEVLGTDRLVQILTQMGRQDDKVMSADVMQEVARRAGVKTVLVGSYMKAGDTIRINLRMQEAASLRIITSERVEANGESNIFPTMDDLTRRVKAKFTIPGAGGAIALLKAPGAAASKAIDDTFDRDLREVTTSSIEAYRYYAEGINLHERGRDAQAQPLLEKAVAIDPGFALAYTKLAVLHNNLGHSNLREEYARKALDHLDRLTPRERYYIQAYYYSGRPETLDKAIENYTKALEVSPNHTPSRNNLGVIYVGLWRFDDAVREYTVLQDRGFEFPGAASGLFAALNAVGQTDRGLEVIQRYTTRFPDSEEGFANLGVGLAVAGRAAEASAAFDRAIALQPGLPSATIGRTALMMLADRWDDVERAGREQARSGNPAIQLDGNIVLAMREIYRGRSREALKFLSTSVGTQGPQGSNESAVARARAAWVLLARKQPAEALGEATRGLADARGRDAQFELMGIAAAAAAQQGRTAEAAKSLAALTQAANALPGSDREKIRVHLTAGLMALASKDTLSAVRELGQAESMLPPGGIGYLDPVDQRGPIIWFALGTAYLAAGQDANARTRFERVAASEYLRLYRPIEFVRSFYYLGQIAERQGDAVKARQHYARFAKYWKDGDLDRPQVEEALRKSPGA